MRLDAYQQEAAQLARYQSGILADARNKLSGIE